MIKHIWVKPRFHHALIIGILFAYFTIDAASKVCLYSA